MRFIVEKPSTKGTMARPILSWETLQVALCGDSYTTATHISRHFTGCRHIEFGLHSFLSRARSLIFLHGLWQMRILAFRAHGIRRESF